MTNVKDEPTSLDIRCKHFDNIEEALLKLQIYKTTAFEEAKLTGDDIEANFRLAADHALTYSAWEFFKALINKLTDLEARLSVLEKQIGEPYDTN